MDTVCCLSSWSPCSLWPSLCLSYTIWNVGFLWTMTGWSHQSHRAHMPTKIQQYSPKALQITHTHSTAILDSLSNSGWLRGQSVCLDPQRKVTISHYQHIAYYSSWFLNQTKESTSWWPFPLSTHRCCEMLPRTRKEEEPNLFYWEKAARREDKLLKKGEESAHGWGEKKNWPQARHHQCATEIVSDARNLPAQFWERGHSLFCGAQQNGALAFCEAQPIGPAESLITAIHRVQKQRFAHCWRHAAPLHSTLLWEPASPCRLSQPHTMESSFTFSLLPPLTLISGIVASAGHYMLALTTSLPIMPLQNSSNFQSSWWWLTHTSWLQCTFKNQKTGICLISVCFHLISLFVCLFVLPFHNDKCGASAGKQNGSMQTFLNLHIKARELLPPSRSPAGWLSVCLGDAGPTKQ